MGRECREVSRARLCQVTKVRVMSLGNTNPGHGDKRRMYSDFLVVPGCGHMHIYLPSGLRASQSRDLMCNPNAKLSAWHAADMQHGFIHASDEKITCKTQNNMKQEEGQNRL